MEGYLPKCWVRNRSNPGDSNKIIKQFVTTLNEFYELNQAQLPNYFVEGNIIMEVVYGEA